MNAPQSKSSTQRNERTAVESGLLLYPENRVLCRLGDSEFDDGLGWNLDLLLRLGIEARACLPLLLYELAKAGHDEFAVLFGIFVGDGTERIKEYAGGLFIGLRGFGKCALKFCLGHLYEFMAAVLHHFKRIAVLNFERGAATVTKKYSISTFPISEAGPTVCQLFARIQDGPVLGFFSFGEPTA